MEINCFFYTVKYTQYFVQSILYNVREENYALLLQFDQHYITREDRSLLSTISPNQAGQERFWTALTKMCNELMQNECLSLGLWHSVPLGLYGTIQQV